MKQRDYEKICKTMEKLCDYLYLNLDKKEIKNRERFLRYASIFQNLRKLKLKKGDEK